MVHKTNINIPPSISNKLGVNLYSVKNHPIKIIKEKIFEYFKDLPSLEIIDPYLSVTNNFDKLRVPVKHPSRSKSDTFYMDEDTVLRTHMTGYMYPLIKHSIPEAKKYIICGDVYRKDEIDSTHYPIFHQIDAFQLIPTNIDVKKDLRERLSGLIKHLFGESCEFKILEDYENPDVYFPFTIDSFEIEVELPLEDGSTKKLEVLGAGTVHPDIMKDMGLEGQQAWAFGLGLERLAMVLFNIPDIRLFWSKDERFLNQFQDGKITKFKQYSKYEICYKDVAFFVNNKFSYNNLCTIAKDEDENDLIESIVLIDKFNKKDKVSHCYRITYRSISKSLTNDEVNRIQESIRSRLTTELQVEIR